MKENQMKKTYYIPLIALLVTSIVMLLIFFIPYSRYTLLSKLDGSLDGSMQYYLCYISSIGEIALFGVLITLCVLELFTTRLFAYRLELTFDLVLIFFSFVFEIMYAVNFAQISSNFTGGPFFISLIVFSLLFITTVVLSIYFVYIPFKKIEKEAKVLANKWEQIEEENNKEKEDNIKSEISSISTKDQMKEYLKEKYNNGELSKEKYLEFLIDLDSND